MANVLVDDTNLTNIANSIRAKNGSSDTYTPAQMSTAIDNIPTGGGGAIKWYPARTGTNQFYLPAGSSTVYIMHSSDSSSWCALDNVTWADFTTELAKSSVAMVILSPSAGKNPSSSVPSNANNTLAMLIPFRSNNAGNLIWQGIFDKNLDISIITSSTYYTWDTRVRNTSADGYVTTDLKSTQLSISGHNTSTTLYVVGVYLIQG